MTWWTHRRMKGALSAYVDGELDDAARVAVAAHLRECWGCSGDVELFRMVKASLRNVSGRQLDSLAAVRLRRYATRLTL
ncbi:MAG: zf-HC2 domain-containing protein [Acidimicrobiales bacterium]